MSQGSYNRLLNYKSERSPLFVPATTLDLNGRPVFLSLPQFLFQDRPKPFMVVDVYLRDEAEKSPKANYAISVLVGSDGKARNIFLLPPCAASCAAVYSGPFDPASAGEIERVVQKLRGSALTQRGMTAEPALLELSLEQLSKLLKSLTDTTEVKT